jgi:hypothetical protein
MLSAAAQAANLSIAQVGQASGTNVTFGTSVAQLATLAQTYRSAFAKAVA